MTTADRAIYLLGLVMLVGAFVFALTVFVALLVALVRGKRSNR